jgi:uncharacterized membrane protein YkvA (DUF1232 family)
MGVIRGATAVASAVRSSNGRHPLFQRITAVPAMVRDTLTGRWAGAPRLRVVGGLAGVLYVLTPIDILPEILLGPFGIADDLAMAAVSVAALLSAAEDWLDARDAAAGSTAPGPAAPGSTAPGEPTVIQGVVIDRG